MPTKAKAKAIKARHHLRSSPKKISARSAIAADVEDEAPGGSVEAELDWDDEVSNHESDDGFEEGGHSKAAPQQGPSQPNKGAASKPADKESESDWTVKTSKKSSREGKLQRAPPVQGVATRAPAPQAAPRAEHSLLKPVLEYNVITGYRDQGSEALKERLQAREEEVEEITRQGLKATWDQGTFLAEWIVVTGFHSSHLQRPGAAQHILGVVRSQGYLPDEARLKADLATNQGAWTGPDGNVDVFVHLQAPIRVGAKAYGEGEVRPFMIRFQHELVWKLEQGRERMEISTFYISACRAPRSLKMVQMLSADCMTLRGGLQVRTSEVQFHNWATTYAILLENGINPDHVLVWISSVHAKSVAPRTGRIENTFEVIIRVVWISTSPGTDIHAGEARLLKDKGIATFAAGGLHLTAYATPELLVQNRAHAQQYSSCPVVTQVAGLPEGISGGTILQYLALDSDNAPFLDRIKTVVVSTGKSTHPVAYFLWEDKPDPGLKWDWLWQSFRAVKKRVEPWDAHLKLRHIVLAAQRQRLKRQMPNQHPDSKRTQRGPPALETVPGTQAGKWLHAAHKGAAQNRPTPPHPPRQGPPVTKGATQGRAPPRPAPEMEERGAPAPTTPPPLALDAVALKILVDTVVTVVMEKIERPLMLLTEKLERILEALSTKETQSRAKSPGRQALASSILQALQVDPSETARTISCTTVGEVVTKIGSSGPNGKSGIT